jgi:hypothetical protein
LECMAGITAMPVQYPIILGASWLGYVCDMAPQVLWLYLLRLMAILALGRAYYTTFDITNKRIGFAITAPIK